MIMTGVDRGDGTFANTLYEEERPDETPLEALQRAAASWYGDQWGKKEKKARIIEKYGRLGPIDHPTSYLPALFVGRRGFFIRTKWNAEKRVNE